ncbi:major facilitator superfamily domain-containing protein [Leucosporidium creatinivorum]|uniref:Major facilitator superfamily domain-containing protein n=1 Tax=Leucosporidium creatinivorum TaxID=106004 RepID=A0A1Y2FEM2_9BASI|nr:major facilitator superfamily domain-containing protein [Leucosporidium creatinivorum]
MPTTASDMSRETSKMADSQHEQQTQGGKGLRHKIAHDEFVKHGDKALAMAEDRVLLTEADSRRICRKTDLNILPLLCWVYFLQILDKSVIGYSAVFGLRQHAGLVGNQYSTIGAVGYYAQLGAQPLAAYLLVKLPVRQMMPAIVFCWGVSLCGMAASNNFGSLVGTRFLLGFFEAACLPLFSLVTISWYRRSEQPLRVAAWYGTNGVATMLGSAISYGLGHINSSVLYSYQIIFLVFGLITVITAPILYFRLDNSIVSARFLSEDDRKKGVERLRANNTGVVNTEFKWKQVLELFIEPKTWLFLAMSFCVNVGASVSNVFGPLILQGLVGFSSYTAILLNIPFGALQLIVILASSWAAYKFKTKSWIFGMAMVPVVIGVAILYALPHEKSNQGGLLVGYYLIAFVFSANPLIVSWMSANTAGATKKAAAFTAFNAASSAGNICGPYLFKSTDAPDYYPGLKAVLAIFCVLVGLVALQAVNLAYLNKRKEKQRVANGKPAKITDRSMTNKYEAEDEAKDASLGQMAFLDLTDGQNDEFQYLL